MRSFLITLLTKLSSDSCIVWFSTVNAWLVLQNIKFVLIWKYLKLAKWCTMSNVQTLYKVILETLFWWYALYLIGCGIFLQTVNKYEWSLYPIVLSVNGIKIMHRKELFLDFLILSIVTVPFERNILERTRNNRQRKIKNKQAIRTPFCQLISKTM